MTRLLVLNLTALACVVAALLVAVALLHLVERAVGRFVAHRLGWRAVLVTGWIGVPVHELSHLVAAVVFRHRIVGWSLFDPDPTTGTLGYVRHAHTRPGVWQLAGYFFIGIAPLVGGAVVLALLLVWMVPPVTLRAWLGQGGLLAAAAPAADPAVLATGAGLAGLARRLPDLGWTLPAEVWRARTWWLPLQLYLCAAVAAHLAPSARDLAGGLRGALVVIALLGAAATIGAATGTSLAGTLLAVPVTALLVVLTVALQLLHALGAAAVAALLGRR
ncbi:MAG: hypothetical protein HY906_07670 [Deltaproteobacteria bacterium]|nr:hypothetical protein [Deltaproteobacteria bacterium]